MKKQHIIPLLKKAYAAESETVQNCLADAGLPLAGLFAVPNSVKTIIPLVGRILVEHETRHDRRGSQRTPPFPQPPRVEGG